MIKNQEEWLKLKRGLPNTCLSEAEETETKIKQLKEELQKESGKSAEEKIDETKIFGEYRRCADVYKKILFATFRPCAQQKGHIECENNYLYILKGLGFKYHIPIIMAAFMKDEFPEKFSCIDTKILSRKICDLFLTAMFTDFKVGGHFYNFTEAITKELIEQRDNKNPRKDKLNEDIKKEFLRAIFGDEYTEKDKSKQRDELNKYIVEKVDKINTAKKKFCLMRIECFLRENMQAGDSLKMEDWSLEHIIPQKVKGDIKKNNGNINEIDTLSEKDIDSLGNLTLLGKSANKSLKDKDTPNKTDNYKSSVFYLTNEKDILKNTSADCKELISEYQTKGVVSKICGSFGKVNIEERSKILCELLAYALVDSINTTTWK